jgi:acetyl-CoA carboxylase biotin carboxyl carrier protein
VLTFEQMKELLEMVASNKLGGVEVRDADFHFRVSGNEPLASVPAPPAAAVDSAPVSRSETPASSPAEPEIEEVEAEDEGYVLKSPIVGTFYSSPSPDADPYVGIGDRIKKGQVLCIVEAMKLMNEIESDVSGVVTKVFHQNAQPVEFGEPLFAIQTD